MHEANVLRDRTDVRTIDDLLGPGSKPGSVPTDLEQSTGLERLEILGKMEGTDLGGHAARRHSLRLGFSPVRPGNGRSGQCADRAPNRTRPGADEALPGNSRVVFRERAEVQRILHVG